MPSLAKPRLVFIDGRSGAGKTSFARDLVSGRGGALVSLDDVYPGWDGLDAGSHHVYREVVMALAEGGMGRYRRWDWREEKPSEWVEVYHPDLVVIEGCGALRRDASLFSSERYWIEADEMVRRERTRERDGEAFADFWSRWSLQEDRFLALHEGPLRATSVITT